jgi:hypothetical protein
MTASITDLDPHRFYTPEEVAPLMGFSKTELRNYCKISGIHTRLSKNRIALDLTDIANIHDWVRERKRAANDWTKEPEHDPFA